MTGSNGKRSGIANTTFGVVLEIIVVLGILFALFILPIMMNAGKGSTEPIYDDSKELKTQDEEASRQVRDYEHQQEVQERQEEYEDYLDWVNGGRP